MTLAGARLDGALYVFTTERAAQWIMVAEIRTGLHSDCAALAKEYQIFLCGAQVALANEVIQRTCDETSFTLPEMADGKRMDSQNKLYGVRIGLVGESPYDMIGMFLLQLNRLHEETRRCR